jgi:hypothetical protein
MKVGDLVIITTLIPEYTPERVGVILSSCIQYKNKRKYLILTDRGKELIEDVFLFTSCND